MEVIIRLNTILAKNAHTRVNGKVASRRTATAAGESLRAMFRLLYELGYKLTDPQNIGERHIVAICKALHERKRKPKTIQGYLSQLRIFCGWIGKKGLVKDVYYYLPDVPKSELRVRTVTDKSKSWAETGIDVVEMAKQAEALDWRFGCMILVQVAFGLRRIEAIQMEPWKVDKGEKFAVYETKGGRPRDIYIDTPVQRAILDLVKSKVTKGDRLGWRQRKDGKPFEGKTHEASLEYSESRYEYLMKKLGITREMANCTGHGLRAQFAENAALLKGVIPPTLGGTAGQMLREDLNLARLQVSESLGHSRISVTGAYYGSFGRGVTLDSPERIKKSLEAGLAAIASDQLCSIQLDRSIDCGRLSAELAAIDIYTDLRKVYILWAHYSRRHAVDWIDPAAGSNLAALEAAALSIARIAK